MEIIRAEEEGGEEGIEVRELNMAALRCVYILIPPPPSSFSSLFLLLPLSSPPSFFFSLLLSLSVYMCSCMEYIITSVTTQYSGEGNGHTSVSCTVTGTH